MSKNDETRVNEKITAKEIRLIGADGSNVGVVPTSQGLKLAEQAGLDLVEISPNVTPPVCKILDYGKYRYEAQKKAKEAHKNQKVVEIKEVKMRPVIDKHDLEIKLNNASRFLAEANKVKFTVTFRGRELDHLDIGRDLMDKIKLALAEKGKIESEPRFEGKQITMIVGPKA